MNFQLSDITKEFVTAFSSSFDRERRNISYTIASAATGAIVDAANALKKQGRDHIRASGFSSKWANAWRNVFYPGGTVLPPKENDPLSLTPAVFFYEKIPYSNIFEKGGTITGKPLLWIPFSSTVKKVGRERATPANLARAGVKLVTMKGAGRKPILGAQVRLSKADAASDITSKLHSLSLAKLKSKRTTGVERTIPLFFGVPSVTIRPRLSIARIANLIRNQLSVFYFNHVKA